MTAPTGTSTLADTLGDSFPLLQQVEKACLLHDFVREQHEDESLLSSSASFLQQLENACQLHDLVREPHEEEPQQD